MPSIWEKQWAHAKMKRADSGNGEDEDSPAVVVGEFGGRFPEGSLERCWAAAFASYLRETGLSDCFFWCVNPNSGDTWGLLKDDWSAPPPPGGAAAAAAPPSPCLKTFKLGLLAAINPRPTRFDARGDVIEEGGGVGYDPAATPMPEEIAKALAEFSRGGGGGGGAVAAAAANGGSENTANNNSARAPAPASASLPAPVTTSHPSGVTVTTVATKSWPSGSTTAYQCDVRIRNEGGPSSSAVPPTLTFSCPASIVEQSWNCTRLSDKDGRAVFGLPDWAAANGGVAPRAEVTAGGVFLSALPTFEVGFS